MNNNNSNNSRANMKKRKTTECKHWAKTGTCKFGDMCDFKHSPKVALPPRRRHQKRSSKECRDWAKTRTCKYGDMCNFTHSPVQQVLQKQQKQHLRISDDVDEVHVAVKKMRKSLCLEVGVDVSGSMSGGPMSAICELLPDLYRTILGKTDHYGCFTFESNVKSLHRPVVKRKVDIKRDVKNLQNNFGGCTALWDGIEHGVSAIQDSHKYRLEKSPHKGYEFNNTLLIITDGHDNSSTVSSFEKCLQLIARPGVPNFQFVVVGLGDVDQGKLKRLCEVGGENCKFLYAKDVTEFKRELQKAREEIRIRVIVREGEKTMMKDTYVQKKSMGEVLSGVQRMQLA
eukprot:m.85541 g.85541  ORF g.85541 m.85541 type:complete len:342 (+) comp12193_c0_seq2:257-1282(+)